MQRSYGDASETRRPRDGGRTFGILDTPRTDCEFEDFHGHKLDRKALELLRRHCECPAKRLFLGGAESGKVNLEFLLMQAELKGIPEKTFMKNSN